MLSIWRYPIQMLCLRNSTPLSRSAANARALAETRAGTYTGTIVRNVVERPFSRPISMLPAPRPQLLHFVWCLKLIVRRGIRTLHNLHLLIASTVHCLLMTI